MWENKEGVKEVMEADLNLVVYEAGIETALISSHSDIKCAT